MKGILTKRSGTVICLFLICMSRGVAQSPNWTVDYSLFQFRMTASAVLERDGIMLAQGENKVAVFVDDEIRGIGYAEAYHAPTDRYLAIFQIGSNLVEGETLRFLMYDESADEVVSVRYTATFSVDGLLGSVNDPIILSENQVPKEIQLSSSTFTENLAVGEAIATLTTLDGDDLSHNYTITNVEPPVAEDLIRIEGDEIVTNNVIDFETLNSFTISLTASDPLEATVSNDFTINVIDQAEAPTSIRLSRQRVPENNLVPYQLAIISAEDEDQDESLTFSFTAVSENADSSFFSINENRLEVNRAIDFEITPALQLYLSVTDKDGLSFNETFTIEVEDEDEPEPVSNYLSPNGDGFNDFLLVENPELYPGFTLKVFTPQGREVFSMTDYDNSWDGYFQGNPLPAGVYQYVFQNRALDVRYEGLLYIKDR